MRVSATRVALVVFLVGALGVWLIRPIGNACPDIGKLPAGSRSSSAPSFVPPLTRTCTYTTAGGIEAHRRYLPIVDWIVLAVLAGVAWLGVSLLGGSGAQLGAAREPEGPPDWLAEASEPKPKPKPRMEVPPSPAKPVRPARPAPAPRAPSLDGDSEAAARAAQRELERQQRARRRER
jgi:hypothetical protein